MTNDTEHPRLTCASVDLYNIQKLTSDKQSILVVNQLQTKYKNKSLDSIGYKILSNVKRRVDKNDVELEFCINMLLESKKPNLNFEQMEIKPHYKFTYIFIKIFDEI